MQEYAPQNSRYDSQIAVFGAFLASLIGRVQPTSKHRCVVPSICAGATLQKRFEGMKLFLVGAGAIGCEMLKNWALVSEP